MRYTHQQVVYQQQRFESLIKTANLVKIGKLIIAHSISEYSTHYEFIRKVLKMYNVVHSMYYPGTNDFYGRRLFRESVTAYSNYCKSQISATN